MCFLIAGLGNVGEEYTFTPHNVGFMVAEEIAGRYNLYFSRKNHVKGYVATFRISGSVVYILKPATFMNNSGISVRLTSEYYKIATNKIIVVHDDIDMPVGKIKIKFNSSSGGHKGVESIIRSLGTRAFTRVKIGVGREDPPERYVLTPFKKELMPAIENIIKTAADACICIISEGLTKAMSTYNGKTLPPISNT